MFVIGILPLHPQEQYSLAFMVIGEGHHVVIKWKWWHIDIYYDKHGIPFNRRL